MTAFFRCVTVLLLLLLLSAALWGQTTGAVAGTVTDKTGAMVGGARVELRDPQTNTTRTATTNVSGQYTISNVPPGTYLLSITAPNFRKFVIPNLRVEVARTATANATLEIGQVTEIVQVEATSAAELQTLDASVGNVLSRNALETLPSLSRDVTALLQLQPMAAPSYNSAPGTGSGDTTSGSVAGARADQNTFIVDGGDATSNTEANGNYNTGQGTPRAVIPTPVESVEEFRVTTNNSNVAARAAGAQVELVTRKGTNSMHGAAYEYNQNTIYNANFWQLNHTRQPRPVWQDNRFGGRVGGPIIKDKAFFFLMYEGRRFKKSQAFSRIVPSELLKKGIMQFRDASGKVVQYNFARGAPTAMCASGPCDPRGLGMNPIIAQIWNTYEPVGNDPSQGDGLNTIGFNSSVPVTTNENQGIARFDYKLTDNWDVMASGRYAVTDTVGAAQVDIGGITPGASKGVPKATSKEPLQPRFYVLGLTGRLSPAVVNNFRFDFLRHFWEWKRIQPFPQLPGLGAALQIFSESNNTLVPLNVDTQNARSRVWNGKDYNFNDEVSWLRGRHLFQFGGSYRRQNFFHRRDDKVTGGLSVPEYYVLKTNTYTSISPAGFVPPTCSATVTTNCIRSSDISRWDNTYAALMGMVDHSAQLLTRASDLTPNPPGTPNLQNSIVHWYDLHFVDTWRATSTLTVSLGLDWGVQTPPYEQEGLQTLMVYADTGKPVLYQDYFARLQANALQGKPFAPVLGFMPIRKTGRKYPYDVDWHNFAPRISLAWSPAVNEDTWLGRIFGNRKSSIRAGYGRYFDRINGVGIVMTPALGIGFGDLVNCNGPNTAGACTNAKITPATGFRIGIDGNNVTIPSLPKITPPVIPGLLVDGTALAPGANSVYEGIDFRIDPHRKNGVEDTWSLSIQRQLSNSAMVEFGYVGRVGRHLYGTADLNQVPYMYTLSGQTFADAYDNVQKALQAGQTPSPQPFFESIGFTGTKSCSGKSGTAAVACQLASSFEIADVTTIWDSLGVAPMPLDQQFQTQQITGSFGSSNYNAGYVTFRKHTSHHVAFQANYTYSHAFDNIGVGQQYIAITPSDQFRPQRDYEESYFDRRHIVSGFFVFDFPFGAGQRLSAGNWLDKVIGGWQLSTAVTASSGLPEGVYNFDSCAEQGAGYYANCAAWVQIKPGKVRVSAHYQPDGSVTAFDNIAAVHDNFRAPLFGDSRMGGEPIRGFNRWNVDAGLTKSTKISESVSLGLALQAVNVFNHMEFNEPSYNLASGTFGKVSTQFNSPRYLNIGIRLDF